MPRTKQIRKRNSNNANSDESDLLVKDFERHTKMKICRIETEYNALINKLVNKIDVSLSCIPDEIRRNLTLGALLHSSLEQCNGNDKKNVTSSSDDHTHEANIPPTTSKNKNLFKRQTAVSTDDGYVTESGVKQKNRGHISRIDIDKQKSTSKRPTRQLRSTSQGATNENKRPRTRSSSNTRVTSKSRLNNKFVTPAASRNLNEYNPITPKVKPNTPMSILRRPREGEMALSMQGSPLLVSNIIPDRIANINVPLNNGNVISLLPNAGLRLSGIPHLDEETKRQLQTLKGHLDKVIGQR